MVPPVASAYVLTNYWLRYGQHSTSLNTPYSTCRDSRKTPFYPQSLSPPSPPPLHSATPLFKYRVRSEHDILKIGGEHQFANQTFSEQSEKQSCILVIQSSTRYSDTPCTTYYETPVWAHTVGRHTYSIGTFHAKFRKCGPCDYSTTKIKPH